MIYDMPASMTVENMGRLVLTGELQLLFRDVSSFIYRWSLDQESTVVTLDFGNRQVHIPDGSPAMLVTILEGALATFGQPPAWDPAAVSILELAQSAVGVDIRDLTAGQIKALLAVVLWDLHAIDNDLNIRPLVEWVMRRPR